MANNNSHEPDPKSEINFKPFLEYLESANGHELASRLLGIVEDIKKSALHKSTSHAIFEKILQATIIVVVVVATSLLTYFQRFDTSIAVLFGTFVGYI